MNSPPGPSAPTYLPLETDAQSLYRAWDYVAGRTTRGALCDPLDPHQEYFWRGFFEANGALRINGELPGGLHSERPTQNHGPRASCRSTNALLGAFLDFLEAEAQDFPANDAQRAQCSAGRLTFGEAGTISLIRCLYNDENLSTDPEFMCMVERILDYGQ